MILFHIGYLGQAHHTVAGAGHDQTAQFLKIAESPHRAQKITAFTGVHFATRHVLIPAGDGIPQVQKTEASLGQFRLIHGDLHLTVSPTADRHFRDPLHAFHPGPDAIFHKVTHQVDVQLPGITRQGRHAEIHKGVGRE